MNDRQLGERLRRAFEAEQPPAVSAAEILQRAEVTRSQSHHAGMEDRESTRTHLRRPVLLPIREQRTLGAVGFDPEERQRHELEEIRRSYQQIGVKVGSFEPARHNDPSTDPPAPPAPATADAPPPAKGQPIRVLAVVLGVACLLLGGGLGYLLHRPTPATTLPPVTTIINQTVPEPQIKVVAPPACLQTAQRGDELIDLFTRNIRDRRLSLALKAYTLASQACRKQAPP